MNNRLYPPSGKYMSQTECASNEGGQIIIMCIVIQFFPKYEFNLKIYRPIQNWNIDIIYDEDKSARQNGESLLYTLIPP